MLFMKYPPLVKIKQRQPELNQLVDDATRAMNIRRLPRDLPSRNRTTVCLDYISMARRATVKLLSTEHRRQPYAAHSAVAIYDAPHQSQRMRDQGMLVVCGTRIINPQFGEQELEQLVFDYGIEDVLKTVKWLAREGFARAACFGTQGLHLRSFMLRELAVQRWALDARFAPPQNYEAIIIGLIEAGLLRVVAFHRSKGVDYAVHRLVSNGRDRISRDE